MTFDDIVLMAESINPTNADKYQHISDDSFDTEVEYESGGETFSKGVTVYGAFRAGSRGDRKFGRQIEPSIPDRWEIIGVVDSDTGMDTTIPLTSDMIEEFEQTFLNKNEIDE